MTSKERKKFFVTLVVLYCISYGFNLFNCGIYWDDWCLVDHDRQTLKTMFSMAGAPWVGDYHYLINQLPFPVFFYRLIAFLAYFVSGLCLLQILRTIPELHDVESLSIVGFFWVFPINTARITLICSPTATCFLAFWLGYYFFVRGLTGGTQPIYLLLSVPLFWFSMWAASLMAFMALPAIHLLFIFLKNDLPWSIRLKKYILFLCVFPLPIIFFAFKQHYFTPYGNLEGYNQLTWIRLKESYTHLEPSFSNCFVGAMSWSSEIAKKVSLYLNLKSFLCLSLLIVIFSRNKIIVSRLLLFAGAATWILGTLPYNCLGEITQDEWTTRNQLLLGLGSSLILVGTIDLIARGIKIASPRLSLPVKIFLTFLLLAIFTKQNLEKEADFYIDWQKQLSIMSAFQNSKEVKEGTLFVFLDDAKMLDAFPRSYRFYEYCGMLRKVFRNSTRFGVLADAKTEADMLSGKYFSEKTNKIMKYYKYKEYNFSEFQPVSNYLRIRISTSEIANHIAENKVISCLKLIRLSILNPQEYGNVVRSLVEIKSY
jgi:hypothetical protein